MDRKRIYLCLAHMSGKEQDFIKEAFDTNWVVPLGPNVNAFEKSLRDFLIENEKLIYYFVLWLSYSGFSNVLHGIHGFFFVDVQYVPISHDPFPVDHGGTDVFAVGCVNDGGVLVVDRNHVAGVGME